jgi:hypothetical protein
MDTDHYDLVPQQLAEKIVATVKRPADSDA